MAVKLETISTTKSCWHDLKGAKPGTKIPELFSELLFFFSQKGLAPYFDSNLLNFEPRYICKRLMLPFYLSNLHSLTWKMFQISGKAPTYVKTYLYSSSVCIWDGKASRSFSFKHLCHLCMEKWWAIGLSRYHSGNWVTSHTQCVT